MGEIDWTNSVRDEEVLHEVNEERNSLYTCLIKRREINWIGHILLRNSLLKHVIEKKATMGNIGDGKKKKYTYAATG
jgi:hypothetical protein